MASGPVTAEQRASAVTAAEIVARARALAPRLRERAAAAEAARCAPAETVEDFHRAGLIRMTQPCRYGGFEMGWDVLCEVGQVLAAADGAQAWIQAIMADHAQMVSTFPPEAQAEVWGDDQRTVMSASFDPTGRAHRVRGGFRFSGRHGFASGIDYADWLICGGFILDGELRGGPHFFLVRRSDVTVIDDWQTIGLEGTGSKSFAVDDVFVPEHRMLDGARARIGQGPGTAVNPAAAYRIPRGSVTPTIFGALAIGMAQGVLDEWLRYTAERTSRGVAIGQEPGSHLIAAECSAEIAAAEALCLGTIRQAMRSLEAGATLSEMDLLTARRNAAFACNLALGAGTRLFHAAGGRAIFKGSGLERQYRNLLAGTAHYAVAWDRNALAYGKALLDGLKA